MASATSLSFRAGAAGASRVTAPAATRRAARKTRAAPTVRAHGPGGGVHLDPNESIAPSRAPKGVAGAAILDRDDAPERERKNVYVCLLYTSPSPRDS